MSHCCTCGGHGFPDKVCPECGRKPVTKAKRKIIKKEKVVTKKCTIIPEPYSNVMWSSDVLRMNHQEESKSDMLFNRYVNQLERIFSLFYNKKIPAKSAIIIAPPQYSKVTFAYSCMQLALQNGFSVAPLYDSQEVKRIITLAADRPNQNYEINYEDYVNSDVVFITITKTVYREEAYAVIEEMLDKRSRRGLPTFFISRYNLQTLSKRDWSGHFSFIKDVEGTENDLKYPAIISYWKSTSGASKGV